MEVTRDVVKVMESENHDFSIEILSHNPEKTMFRMKSAPPIINAIRRIILDETPTVAPDTLVVHQNTSVMHDEVLAQRLGLIPLQVDPTLLDFPDETLTETNTIVFTLDIKAQNETITVYSGDLCFCALGDQVQRLGKVRPTIETIPIVRLGPGQELRFELYCHKGIGKNHAKWSPCSVAFYKMNPIFKYKGQQACWDKRSLKQLSDIKDLSCPRNVFDDLEELQIDRCTLCRECLKHPGLQIFLDDTDYVFIIEPVGYQDGLQIMMSALQVLKMKTQLVIDGLS